MFDLAPRQVTKNDDFDGVGSLASRWILAVKLLERPPLRTSTTIPKSTSLVVKVPLLYRQVLPEGHTILFSDFTKNLSGRSHPEFTVEIGSKNWILGRYSSVTNAGEYVVRNWRSL